MSWLILAGSPSARQRAREVLSPESTTALYLVLIPVAQVTLVDRRDINDRAPIAMSLSLRERSDRDETRLQGRGQSYEERERERERERESERGGGGGGRRGETEVTEYCRVSTPKSWVG